MDIKLIGIGKRKISYHVEFSSLDNRNDDYDFKQNIK